MMVNGIFALEKLLAFKLDGPFTNSLLPFSFTVIPLILKPCGMSSVPASVMTWKELSFGGGCTKHRPKKRSMTMAFT